MQIANEILEFLSPVLVHLFWWTIRIPSIVLLGEWFKLEEVKKKEEKIEMW